MQRRRHPRSSGRPALAQSASPLVADRPPRAPGEEPIEIARYIAQLTAEMTRLAAAAQLDLLAYLLSMAQSEADAAARATSDTQPD
ncbi:MAG TPA: hypothetical protein VMU56_09515 [Beijerinckiaceae bacterium]|nr:hypothetical protein [Beijerinckiaceae bacterium]HVB89995.1 hypothetical protein [Beijerinckiaceae bacterium]